MKDLLYLFQILVAIFLIFFILLQKRSSAFGSSEVFYPVRRGLEKKIFGATIIFGFLFVVLALFNLIFY